jgi:hypothetical protein
MADAEDSRIRPDDFKHVYNALLAAYRPILDEILKPPRSPEELLKDADKPRSCDDEAALARRIFDAFFTEEVALRLLPDEGRRLLGPVDRWRWCFLHIRCCLIFGWLICRGPRTFPASVDALYRYWRCVREVLGTPISNPPTAEERGDFEILVAALEAAFRQQTVEKVPSGLADDALAGKLDCLSPTDDAIQLFEQTLTTRTAAALLGRAAFERHSQDPTFWFCRCWCLCSIRFGCCLARARTLIDLIRCIIDYFECLDRCFGRLRCEITEPDPNECVEEKEFTVPAIFRGIEIRGTATGAFCDHYTLEWRPGFGPWNNIGIHYPGGAATGGCGVVNGTLGWLQTMPFVAGGLVEIRLCVHSSQANVAPECCFVEFELSKNEVWIRSVEGVEAPALFDPNSQLTDGGGVVRSFGTALRVSGSAVVGGCAQKKIKQFTLSFHPGFVVNPLLPGFVRFWQVDYISPFQIDAGFNNVWEDALTAFWRQPNAPPALCNPFAAFLQDTRWSTQIPQGFPVVPSEPPCPAPAFWNSTPIPLINCQSGRYTLRLTTEDTAGALTHHLRQIWIDNKDMPHSHAHITGLVGINPCQNIDLADFAPPNGDCSVPWIAPLAGTAFDELIEEGNLAVPSDNFGGFSLWIKKDGMPNPGVLIPIPGPSGPPAWGGPTVGTSRVGEPGTRCPSASPPPAVIPPASDGILALLDMRRLDAICNPAEPQLTLKPQECCGYILTLLVWDNSICPSLGGGRHQREHTFPLCICNNVRR